jgi:hypothetical protein
MKKVINVLFTTALLCMAVVFFKSASPESIAVVSIVGVVLFAVAKAPTKNVYGFRGYFYADAEMPFTAAQKVLYDYLTGPNADVNTKTALLNRELSINSYCESLKFQIPISSGGKIELLNATTAYRQGRIPIEFNQGFLPKGFNVAISHVRAAFGSDAALLPEAIVNYVTVASAFPAALQHSQIRFLQNNVLKEQFTGRASGTAVASTESAIEKDGFEFQTPFILEEGKPVTIELFCPTGVTFPATPAILSVAIELYGAVVRPRS